MVPVVAAGETEPAEISASIFEIDDEEEDVAVFLSAEVESVPADYRESSDPLAIEPVGEPLPELEDRSDPEGEVLVELIEAAEDKPGECGEEPEVREPFAGIVPVESDNSEVEPHSKPRDLEEPIGHAEFALFEAAEEEIDEDCEEPESVEESEFSESSSGEIEPLALSDADRMVGEDIGAVLNWDAEPEIEEWMGSELHSELPQEEEVLPVDRGMESAGQFDEIEEVQPEESAEDFELVSGVGEIEVLASGDEGSLPERPIPAFLDDSDDDWDRPVSVSQRDADRALLALAEARARVDRFELLARKEAESDYAGDEGHASEDLMSAEESDEYFPSATRGIEEHSEVPGEDEPSDVEERGDDAAKEPGGPSEAAFADEEEVGEDLPGEDLSRLSFLERIAGFAEKSRRVLEAESVSICDRDGFPLYSATENSRCESLESSLLLDVSVRAERLLGLEKGRATQVSPDGQVWHCLIRGSGEAGDLYAGFHLRRPLESEEIERWTKSLAEVVAPGFVKGRDS
ncbi:MAG: hypothetical protein KDN18_21145 [Verrucomicrobiae bacterium]|nr:hypothetical protein [Verrucomicrobiae bacterium]